MPNQLTHFDDDGASRMVDVGQKPATHRMARASATVVMARATAELIQQRGYAKGDVLEVARLAGIMAAKRTGDLIPLCHPMTLTAVRVDLAFADAASPGGATLRIEATAETVGPTGVEMEALTAASVAALTVYDMGKAVDRGMIVEAVQLEEKRGGKSGDWRRE